MRARFSPQLAATFALVGLVYPFMKASSGTAITAFRTGGSRPLAPSTGRHRRRRPGVSQVIGALGGVAVATLRSVTVYGILKQVAGLRLDPEAEFTSADLSIHKVSATAERETNW